MLCTLVLAFCLVYVGVCAIIINNNVKDLFSNGLPNAYSPCMDTLRLFSVLEGSDRLSAGGHVIPYLVRIASSQKDTSGKNIS